VHRLEIANKLEIGGERDAAGLLRRETIRRATTSADLKAIRLALAGREFYPVGEFRKEYRRARNNRARLGIVRRYLQVAPHDARLRTQLLALLEAAGEKLELRQQVRRIRSDPFAEAGLLADCAAALKRIGDEYEARRTFGELTERAAYDPWARAFVGDRLRNEGWFDDATATYRALELLVPNEPAATLRLALAHHGAGRLDIARRTLERVAQTGGRRADNAFSRLAAQLAALLLAETRADKTTDATMRKQLEAVALEQRWFNGRALIVVRTPAARSPIEASLVFPTNSERAEQQPEFSQSSMGVYVLPFDEKPDAGVKLKLRGPELLVPARKTSVRVDALLPKARDQAPSLVSTEVELPANGKPIVLAWRDGTWKRTNRLRP